MGGLGELLDGDGVIGLRGRRVRNAIPRSSRARAMSTSLYAGSRRHMKSALTGRETETFQGTVAACPKSKRSTPEGRCRRCAIRLLKDNGWRLFLLKSHREGSGWLLEVRVLQKSNTTWPRPVSKTGS